MIRVSSICSIEVKFNIDLSFSEIGKLNQIHKWLYTHREKESGRVGKSSWKQLWKFQVNQKTFGKIYIYIYIYITYRYIRGVY